ncbi:glutathionylspermidine synthase family protein [Peribacillus acanthi]|uniref:glutathionylspermidine synthase family protein n=1 Tax=Peribacillus acanthi TaxID=2171554 RepID=UPI000D3ED501|nr:glutathionylspermidine synthase family protein [Peribacillus acanthi]
MNTSIYHERRKCFYEAIPDFWHDLYGEEYALYDISLTSKKEIEDIHQATERIGHVFFKLCSLMRKVPESTLLEMGFPSETLSFLRLRTLPVESVISRLDLVRVGNTYKCIEINADTPTFIKELFSINSQVVEEFQMIDPNEGVEKKLGETIRTSILQAKQWLKKDHPHLVFTAHEDNVEDRNTVIYLKELSSYPSDFVPLHKLQIKRGEGLFNDNGKRIDILYRQTFPIETLLLDADEQGNEIGNWLLELVQSRKLAIINPPSAFLLQNKAIQAVIWSLHEENHPFFTDTEHQWIDEYFLPTYLEPDVFIEKGLAFVKKPAFGREGDTVEIYNQSGQLTLKDSQESYSDYLQVYQEFVEMPLVSFQSEKGKQEGHQLIGSFLLNGKPGAIGYRVGNRITNNLSYYLPIGIEKEGI